MSTMISKMFYVKRTQTYEFQLGRKMIVGTP